MSCQLGGNPMDFYSFFLVLFTKCQADRTIIWQNCIALYCKVCSLSLSLSLCNDFWQKKQTTPFSTFLRVPCNDVPGPWLVMTLPSTTALASWGWSNLGLRPSPVKLIYTYHTAACPSNRNQPALWTCLPDSKWHCSFRLLEVWKWKRFILTNCFFLRFWWRTKMGFGTKKKGYF